MRACDRPACNSSSLRSRSQELQCTDCRHASGIVIVDQRIRMFTGCPAEAGTTAQRQQIDCGAVCACWESISYPVSSLQGTMFKHSQIQPSMPHARWPALVALYITDAHQCEPFTCAMVLHTGCVHGTCQWCCSWTGGQCCEPLVMAAHRSAAARRRSTAAWHAAARSRRHCTAGDQGWHPECTAMSPALVQQCSSAQHVQGQQDEPRYAGCTGPIGSTS
jgi:hypothetical protein